MERNSNIKNIETERLLNELADTINNIDKSRFDNYLESKMGLETTIKEINTIFETVKHRRELTKGQKVKLGNLINDFFGDDKKEIMKQCKIGESYWNKLKAIAREQDEPIERTLEPISDLELKETRKATQKPTTKSKDTTETKDTETETKATTSDLKDTTRLNINIDTNTYKKLKIYATLQDISITDILNNMIVNYLKNVTDIDMLISKYDK
jgi:hypothetical protein